MPHLHDLMATLISLPLPTQVLGCVVLAWYAGIVITFYRLLGEPRPAA